MWRNTQHHVFHKRILFVIGASAAILFLLLSAEFGARLWIACCKWNVRNYRLSRPIQDANSPYWSVGFINEYDKLNQVMTDYGYVIFADFHGEYYNVENGARRTVGQPSSYTHTLWLFGNSGTFDPYVPDSYTMASQLQSLLNRSGYRWRVVNLAVNATLISAEYGRLQHTDIRRGDIVVFIDGMVDRPLNCRLYTGHGALVDLGCEAVNNLPALNPQPTVERYNGIVAAAGRYARNQGATFYHLLQPLGDPGWVAAFGKPFVYVPPDDFFDGDHLDQQGDSIVARALFDTLTRL